MRRFWRKRSHGRRFQRRRARSGCKNFGSIGRGRPLWLECRTHYVGPAGIARGYAFGGVAGTFGRLNRKEILMNRLVSLVALLVCLVAVPAMAQSKIAIANPLKI